MIQVNDTVKVGKGGDTSPEWLAGTPFYYGKVINFLTALNGVDSQMVVEIDYTIDFQDITGKYLVLEINIPGQTWENDNVTSLKIALCEREPENYLFTDEELEYYKWVEDDASFCKM